MKIDLFCQWCGERVTRRLIDFVRNGPNVFCNKKCFGQSRRLEKSDIERRAEKAVYDRAYRATNLERIKRKKAAYFQRTYDPDKARIERAKRMPLHVEYCRRPEYRRYKQRYDEGYRAKKQFGAFAECSLLLKQIEREVAGRMSDYEIRLQQGTLNKCQNRRKQLNQI